MINVEITRGKWQGWTVSLSGHALARWQDRCCNGDEFTVAMERLQHKLDEGAFKIKKDRPKWAYKSHDLKHKILTEGYLIINQPKKLGEPRKEVAFPLTMRGDKLVGTTALVQGWDRGPIRSA